MSVDMSTYMATHMATHVPTDMPLDGATYMSIDISIHISMSMSARAHRHAKLIGHPAICAPWQGKVLFFVQTHTRIARDEAGSIRSGQSE